MRTKTIILFGMLFLNILGFATTLRSENLKEISFQLRKLDFDMTFNKEELPTYLISYPGTSVPVFVGIVDKGETKHFIVLRGTVEVQYTTKPGFFGVDKVKRRYATSIKTVINKQIDYDQFTQQRIIYNKSLTLEEGLNQIASLFPNLVK